MRVIHTADIHLGSQMTSHMDSDKAGKRRAELLSTFERMVDYAKENGVRAVMLCGDIFDTSVPSEALCERFLDKIAGAPKVDFLYLRGNHDENLSFIRMKSVPDNLKLFSRELTEYSYGDVDIFGAEYDYTESRLCLDNLRCDRGRVSILMLHPKLEEESESAFLSGIPKGIDYLALGHIHNRKGGALPSGGRWQYSGIPEGRGFDECGECGFYLLDIGDGEIRSEFVPFAKRTIHEVSVDISSCNSAQAVRDLVKGEVWDKVPRRSDMLRLYLVGAVSPDLTTDNIRNYVESALEEYFLVSVKEQYAKRIDIASYADDESVIGEAIRRIDRSDMSDEKKGRIAEILIKAFRGEKL